MSALAKLATPAADDLEKPEEVLIHVRYAPNAEIVTIDKRPDHLSSRAWLDLLLAGASQHYQILAGGRGFFRIPVATFQAIQASV